MRNTPTRNGRGIFYGYLYANNRCICIRMGMGMGICMCMGMGTVYL